MLNRAGYLRVQEAVDLLGVCANTVRAWGAEGKIPEYRHPVNKYRLFKRVDLEKIIRKLERSVSEVTAPRPVPVPSNTRSGIPLRSANARRACS